MTGGAAQRGAGVWPNGRARGLGPRDCRFESCHSEIRQNHMMAVWFCRFLLSETTDGGQVRSMTFSLLTILDMIGTVAFAISGALTGIRQRMDIFGVNVLAICTATGGGMLRDIIVGRFPPAMFRNPAYVAVACVTANIVFLVVRRKRAVPKTVITVYDKVLFWFDTFGLAAFTVDGVMMGIDQGYGYNIFLISFLGFTTGVGGGALRDILANQMPYIFRKHIYAIASIAGAVTTGLFEYYLPGLRLPGMLSGFAVVILLRFLAAHYEWNLPVIKM